MIINIPSNEITNQHISPTAGIELSKLATETRLINVPLELLRVWDAFTSALPSAASSDDLGLVQGTFGTATPTVQSIDFKNTTTTAYARFLARLPHNYVAAGTLDVVIYAGAKTTVASSAMTLDVEAYQKNLASGAVSGTDLVTTSPISINSTTLAARTFSLTSSTLSPNDEIDVRIKVTGTDSATPTEVAALISRVCLQLQLRG